MVSPRFLFAMQERAGRPALPAAVILQPLQPPESLLEAARDEVCGRVVGLP
jgi:hypothetical protein